MAPVAVLHVQPRPWLDLYGVHVRVRTQKSESIQVELAPIQKLLPDEVMIMILGKLEPYALGKAACSCRQWRTLIDYPRLWEQACAEAFRATLQEPAALRKVVMASYRGSWRRMFLEHPHLRFDGIYVSRNTYVRTGVVEWTTRNPVHLVTYYRYYRFFNDGTLLYRTTPLPVGRAAKSLRTRPRGGDHRRAGDEHVYAGTYALKGNKLYCVVVYDNCRSTEIRSVLKLRSTHPGANNRLDIERIFSFDRDLGTETTFGQDPEGVDQRVLGASREHQRGMTCCVHVPWDQILTSPLNMSATQMDYYMPG